MTDKDDLYIVQMAVTGDIKIGRTKNISRRMVELQTGCPHTLRLLLLGTGLGSREHSLHHRLRHHRTRHQRSEWFREGALADLPVEIYNLMSVKTLEESDWWVSHK
jgi:hypothetical protein